MQGAVQLNAMSADRHYPLNMPTSMHDDARFFRSRRILRTVSPKINADRAVAGYPGLTVVSASTEHVERRHYFRAGPVALPGSKTPEILNVELTASPKPPKELSFRDTIRRGIDAAGRAVTSSRHDFEPKPPRSSFDHKYRTEEEVYSAYQNSFPKTLAVAGLVAYGMKALDIDLDTKPAQAILNDWREIAGEAPIERSDFWAEIEDHEMGWYLARAEQ